MSSLKEHMIECEEKLGNGWFIVHKWLDEFAPSGPSMLSGSAFAAHRAVRHHRDGVEEVRARWGDEGAKAAELHILADFKDLGWEQVPSREEVEKLFE